MAEKSIFTGSKVYLEKSFLEELAYKVWTTKGARFKADERLRDKARMSSISMSIFSAYLIIAGLISVYVGSHASMNFQLINYSLRLYQLYFWYSPNMKVIRIINYVL